MLGAQHEREADGSLINVRTGGYEDGGDYNGGYEKDSGEDGGGGNGHDEMCVCVFA